MELQLYNTRTRSLETFAPLDGKTARMYCCGPTVYHFAHIGNLRTYLFEDILRRSLLAFGFGVQHVMNITDVGHLTDDGDEGEDKMIKSARERGLSVWDIAELYTKHFFEDCARLNIGRPEIVCKATDHITDMIALIRRLEERGFTYVSDGNVYFDIAQFPRYTELARLDREGLQAGARIAVDSAKRNPHDFVLWFTNSKFKDQAMVWDSPWGRGYPGWHIECSAMSLRYLGEQFDIHCGGVDHINVHHTNEIAQSEAASGRHPWVNFWLHGEFLNLNNAKMSKSAGGTLTVEKLISLGFDPLDYRYFNLGAHYRTQLNFNDETMAAARSARSNLIDRLKSQVAQAEAARPGSGRDQTRAAQRARDARRSAALASGRNELAVPSLTAVLDSLAGTARGLLESFLLAVSEDLNMPKALAVVYETLKAELSPAERLVLVHQMDHILGLELLASAEDRISAEAAEGEAPAGFSAEEIEALNALVAERKAARAAKDFARGDAIRDELKARGIMLVDTPQGTTFKRL